MEKLYFHLYLALAYSYHPQVSATHRQSINTGALRYATTLQEDFSTWMRYLASAYLKSMKPSSKSNFRKV
ncbi:hypothetical protein B6N60_01061 [Richelia sinica FACHB-800]|uniref:Uncharacterized protein n=1 Tax=Richelia sinica FACHB-800 TaxID=1357546 RepID=A0A975Y3Q6_9NOST|nr:hypothetical protein B6N60_01061 [Richelia sinica FACHB-800]